jgi:predicted phosphodiesterase
MKYLFILSLIISCSRENSPWESDVEDDKFNLKNIERLKDTDDGTFKPFNLAIIGDPQVGHMGFNEAKNTINNFPIDLVVVAGDLTDRGLKREWEWVKDVIVDFEAPVFTVVGNHDGLSKGNDIYKQMFGPLNYSFTYRQHHFIMWNNNKYEWGSPDFDWLEKEAQNPRSIIISHQPPYSGTLNDSEEERWREIRQNGNVIHSIHGHLHHFNLRYEERLPIYTVERVDKGKWGAMEVGYKQTTYFNCHETCEVARD